MSPMRTLVFALLLLAPLALPSVPAQAAAEPLLTDETGDVQLAAFGPTWVPVPASAPESATASIDLVSLSIGEDDEAFLLTLRLVDLASPVAQGANYGILFDWGDRTYGAVAGRSAGGWGRAALYLVDDNRFEYQLNLDYDVQGNDVAIVLPRVHVLDRDDRAPLKGDELQNVRAYANTYGGLFLGVVTAGTNAYDLLPSEGDGKSYNVLFGGESQGHLRLVAPDAIRVSNGGATTFVFETFVQNTGESDDDVKLAITDLPDGWNARMEPTLRVAANSEKPMRILVSVPFAHEHGGFSAFKLTVTSARDPSSYASAKLGVLHTPVPMPAGHHPDLYLHAVNTNTGPLGEVFPFTAPRMNTVEDHAEDIEDVNINEFGSKLGWRIDLEPALRMGLDFDIEALGTLAGALRGRQPTDASVAAELWLTRDGEDDTLLADSDSVALALDPNTATPFTLTLAPTGDADYVAYAPGQGLRLRILLDGGDLICCGTATSPQLSVAAFKMTLPLNEYHDRITAATIGSTSVTLTPEGPTEKAGRPGDLMTYAFTLRNGGSDTETFLVEPAGTDASLASLAPTGSVQLAAGEERRITLGVRIPSDATDAMHYEVLVFVRASSDPTVSAIGRTTTGIAHGAEAAPDESAVFAAAQADAKDTPGAGLLAALAGIALAALTLRRR